MAESTCRFPFSISMTTCSTVLALGMMPLCLLIYTKLWVNSGMIVIPFDNIGKSLLRQISQHGPPPASPPPALLLPGWVPRRGLDPAGLCLSTAVVCAQLGFQDKPGLHANEGLKTEFQTLTPWENPLVLH